MNIQDIEPTIGHVLIEVPKTETEVGGVILAGDQQNNAPVRGTVIRVPDTRGVLNQPPRFKVGETIFFRKYAVDELKFQDESLQEVQIFIVDEEEVLGVIRPIVEEPEVPEVAPQEARAVSKAGDNQLKAAVKK